MKHEPNHCISNTADDEACVADLIVCRNADKTWAVFLYLPDASIQADGFATSEDAHAWAVGEVEVRAAQERQRRRTPVLNRKRCPRGGNLASVSTVGQEG